MKSDTILAEVKAIYEAGRKDYRDHLIKLGRKLHEFIVQYMIEDSNNFRKWGVHKAATELGITIRRVSDLVGAAMTVDMLSDHGEIGKIGFGVIKAMGRMVIRKELAKEEWKISPQYPEAVWMFREAVRKNLAFSEVQLFMDGGTKVDYSFGQPKRDLWNKDRFKEGEPNHVEIAKGYLKTAMSCSPGDAAEILFEIVKENEAPALVVIKLEQMVAELKSRRRHAFAL